jgi:hypothetical protein
MVTNDREVSLSKSFKERTKREEATEDTEEKKKKVMVFFILLLIRTKKSRERGYKEKNRQKSPKISVAPIESENHPSEEENFIPQLFSWMVF